MGFSLLGLGFGDGVMYGKQKNSMVLLEHYHECNHISFIKKILCLMMFYFEFLFIFILFFILFLFFLFFFRKNGATVGVS